MLNESGSGSYAAPRPQFWGPAIGGSGKFLCSVSMKPVNLVSCSSNTTTAVLQPLDFVRDYPGELVPER